jgi:hypothetical protein
MSLRMHGPPKELGFDGAKELSLAAQGSSLKSNCGPGGSIIVMYLTFRRPQ